MLQNDLWDKFYLTGNVNDYINYSQSTKKGFEIIEPKSKGFSAERDDNQGKRQGTDDIN